MKTVCITGTRIGLTPPQRAAVERLLAKLAPSRVLHGACLGADTETAEVTKLLNNRPRVIAFPGPKGPWQNQEAFADEWMSEENHFARNRRMVNLSDVVVALPKDHELGDRGGTAYTANFALKNKKDVYVVSPGGVVRLLRHDQEETQES